MEIRLIAPQETDTLKSALTLARDVFWDLVAQDYGDEGIWEFDNYIEYASISAMLRENRMLMWGYFTKEGRLIGMLAATPPCHISLFFVDKRAHRKGVGRMMFEEMRAYFEKDAGCEEITVHSSPYAVEVYRHLGFEATGEETVENGIRYLPMRLRLKPEPPPAKAEPNPEPKEEEPETAQE